MGKKHDKKIYESKILVNSDKEQIKMANKKVFGKIQFIFTKTDTLNSTLAIFYSHRDGH